MDLDLDSRDELGNQSDDPNGESDSVWGPEVEQCFREALLMYPVCGRRKHSLLEEGGNKMYGRNELIARYIQMRTGKQRTRKQVSSHIQVLARRKAKADAGGGASGSSAGVSPSPSSNVTARSLQAPGQSPTLSAIGQPTIGTNNRLNQASNQQQQPTQYDVWSDRPIVTAKIRLVEFSAYVEYNSASQHQFNQTPHPLQLNTTTTTTTSNESLQAVPDLSMQLERHMNTTSTNQQLQPVQPASHLHQPAALAPNQQNPLATSHQAQFNHASSYQSISNSSSSSSSSLVPNHKLAATNLMSPSASSVHQHHPQQQQQHLHHAHHQNQHLNNQTLQTQPQHQQPQQQQQLASTSAGSIRHSYIKINYSQPQSRQVNKLERIDINQIQDKFPEISGPDGLFQRGPSDAFFLVKFWADLNNDYEYNINDQNSFFGFSSHFETINFYRDITCSTKACSYGLRVIEKVEKIYGCYNNLNGRYSYDMNRSPMCEFMIQFIRKLRQLPQPSHMNSVLENFTVLQVITSESTSEILLCLAYVFEVGMQDHMGPQYNVYKLTKD